ncbi:twin-arginine translocase subunit TatC [Tomitella gaofuii]|uniref:twin-arginine translocase subunit TatC n=1 Tax=Tomitella gaofuii TaxID=2760083 RepID=UPI002E2C60F6|nr:twin-arginine translocase subunit TatC [Tomitella gaofuii]
MTAPTAAGPRTRGGLVASRPSLRGTMPLRGHFREARHRGLRAAAAVALGVIAGFLLSAQILDILRGPIEELARSREASLNYDTVTAAFDLKLTIAVLSGIVLSSPVWLFELFAFVTPGLTRREKRTVFGFAAAAVPLFALGCMFGFTVFPRMVHLLTGFASDQDSTILTASYYVGFAAKTVVAIGVAFVLPVFLVMLNFVGLVSARALRHGWRWIVIVIALFSALVTPAADVFSMFLIAVPMSALFGGALLITVLHDRRAARKDATPCSV